MKKKIVVGICVVCLCVLCCIGINKAKSKNVANLTNSELALMGLQQSLQQTDLSKNMTHVINSITKQSTLTLTEEQGSTSLNVGTYNAKWNKWLTQSEVDMTLDYKVLIGINTEDITFVQDDDKLLVIFNDSSFHVQAVEVLDKSIESQRSLFGKSITDDEKVAIEKQIVEEVKSKVISDSEIRETCKESLYEYIMNLCNSFGVDNVEVIG